MKKIILIIAVVFIGLGIFLIEPKEKEVITDPGIEDNSPTANQSVMKLNYKLVRNNEQLEANASAVIISSDDNFYYVVTNYHAINHPDFTAVELKLTDFYGNQYDGEIMVINTSHKLISQFYDLALIKFTKTEVELSPVIIRVSPLNISDLVTSIGYVNDEKKIEMGYFNGLGKFANSQFDIIDHSCEIERGFSGGGLFDRYGKLVGINFGVSSTDQGQFITAYAIPVSCVLEYIQIFNI
ncbi:S1 family peptidase [Acholeplasma hippikon]|uniref:Periplasmic serine endoprotease DegP n=1 Tax=Acholeplasma hippikon TaxID=264636 RepID=A0A449BJW1_9MOLU|nr:serine protease [Acholeplasma hippikon]VEU82761.1 Periplasmic serine endoprotease DegP precursor [Acholeplasma hippikon]